jgi:hypothetical protein
MAEEDARQKQESTRSPGVCLAGRKVSSIIRRNVIVDDRSRVRESSWIVKIL